MKPLMMLTLLATSVGANAMSAGEYVAKLATVPLVIRLLRGRR